MVPNGLWARIRQFRCTSAYPPRTRLKCCYCEKLQSRARGCRSEKLTRKRVFAVIAWMINGCDDEAGIGQRLCSVMMHGEPPAPTVGEDNQRQLLPSHGTVFHAR